MIAVQVHLEFIKVCMMRLQRIYEGLQQYKPGEIEQEPQEVQHGYNTEVHLSPSLTATALSNAYNY